MSNATFIKWAKGQWDVDTMRDLATHGADSGFSGITYYTETREVYEAHEQDIWEMVNEDADNQGVTPLELIATFGGATQVTDHATFVNLLVWYASERVAQQLTDEDED